MPQSDTVHSLVRALLASFTPPSRSVERAPLLYVRRRFLFFFNSLFDALTRD